MIRQNRSLVEHLLRGTFNHGRNKGYQANFLIHPSEAMIEGGYMNSGIDKTLHSLHLGIRYSCPLFLVRYLLHGVRYASSVIRKYIAMERLVRERRQ